MKILSLKKSCPIKINPNIIYSIFLLISLSYISCNPCPDKDQVRYQKIYSGDRDLIPYNGGEVLKFVHINTGDTLTFVGEPAWTPYNNYYYSGADCPIKTNLEGRGIGFIDASRNKVITLNQYVTKNGDNYFTVDFADIAISTAYLSNDNKFRDSLQIQHKMYYDIYFYSNSDIFPKPTDFGCYYTWKDGIIKLFSDSGDAWELVKQ